jgi:PKD repeat protein
MRTFGTRTRYFVFLLILFFNANAFAQICTPPIDKCNDNKCGGAKLSLATDENNVFCQGQNVVLKIDKTQTSDFDSFFVYWCDGTVIKSKADKFEFSHKFDVPDSLVCKTASSNYEIGVVGKKYCGTNDVSCRYIITSIKLNHEPRANFEFQNQICRNKTLSFKDLSCNVPSNQPDAYQWTFHDGTSSTVKNPIKTYTAAGNFPVQLRVTNQCGSHEITKIVSIVDFPDSKVELSINAVDSVVCVGDIITLIDKSNIWSIRNRWTLPINNYFRDTNEIRLIKSIRDLDKVLPIDTIIFLDTLIFEVLKAGNYNFLLTSENNCSKVEWRYPLKVVDAPTVNLNSPPQYCDTANYTPSLIAQGEITKYEWTFVGGSPSSSTLKNPGVIKYDKPGVYDVELKVTAPCDVITRTVKVIVNGREPIVINSPDNYCSTSTPDTLRASIAGGTWSGLGIIDAKNGVFDPSRLASGKYKLTYTFGPTACQTIISKDITIIKAEPVNIEKLNLCENSPLNKLVATPIGGQWSGQYVDSNGQFDAIAAGIGSHKVKYELNDINSCLTSKEADIIVEKLPTLTSEDTTLQCISNGTLNLITAFKLAPSPMGGNFSFKIDSIQISPILDLSTIKTNLIPITITYSRNACSTSKLGFIQFIEKPEITLTSDTSLCAENGFFRLTSSIQGGVWSGNGINPSTGNIDLSKSTTGKNLYTYIFAKGSTCEVSKTTIVDVINLGATLNIGNNEETCESLSPTYTLAPASQNGGVWSGNGINANSGSISLLQLIPDSTYTYRYCIKSEGLTSCEACKTKTFRVNSLPKPSFDIVGKMCLLDTLKFSNTSSNYQNAIWTIDGATYNTRDAAFIFKNAGSYIINLQTNSNKSCSNTISKTIVIGQPPVAKFNLQKKESCAPFLLNIIDYSQAENIIYNWLINGTNYVGSPPNITLKGTANDTTYHIKLNVSNTCGIVSYEDSVTVKPKPIVNFGFNVQSGCSPLLVNFSNTSVGNADRYSWNLGNSQFSTNTVPTSQRYFTTDSTVSTYDIKLIGSNTCGVDSLTKQIKVFPPNVKAFIEATQKRICQYGTLNFVAYSTIGAINTWEVVSPLGRKSGSSGSYLQHQFKEAGLHRVVLYASNCGTHTDSAFIEVLPAPKLDFKLPLYLCEGELFEFEYIGNFIGKVEWSFGDGTISADNRSVHSYGPGDYDISLTAYSLINDCPITVTKKIKVLAKPKVSFEASSLNGCQPFRVNFNNTSIGNNKYLWTFNDGSSSSSLTNPNHLFLNSGTFKVQLNAFNEFNCASDTSVINLIVHTKPKALFDLDKTSVCIGYDTVRLEDKSMSGSRWQWFSNDSLFSSIKNPNYVPASRGQKNLKLIVSSIFNCMDTVSTSLNVKESPIAYYDINTSKGCQPLLINFANKSTNATSQVWTFGDNNSSVSINPYNLFINEGKFVVTLTAKNQNGCPDHVHKDSILVWPKPKPVFNIEKNKLCGVPSQVIATNNSAENLTYEWFSENNLISTQRNLALSISQAKTVALNLRLTNEFNCKDSLSKSIDVYLQPKALFDASTLLCENDKISIINTSQSALSYEWYVNNVLSSKDKNFRPSNIPKGEHDILLKAFYNSSCRDSLSVKNGLKVFESPIANFSFTTDFDNGTLGEVKFTNESSRFNASRWNFGDGTNSDVKDPLHIYNINRDITARLTVLNINNGTKTCLDSISKLISPEWITTFFAPNAISPEYGETKVRLFQPTGLGLKTYDLAIYSPWGVQVWQSNKIDDFGSPSEAWDGTYRNEIVPQGAYTWRAKIEYVSGVSKVLTGSVTVIR